MSTPVTVSITRHLDPGREVEMTSWLQAGTALAQRFPGESTKGTTWYAISRAMQMKFMRMPKAQVKIGQQLPEHYR